MAVCVWLVVVCLQRSILPPANRHVNLTQPTNLLLAVAHEICSAGLRCLQPAVQYIAGELAVHEGTVVPLVASHNTVRGRGACWSCEQCVANKLFNKPKLGALPAAAQGWRGSPGRLAPPDERLCVSFCGRPAPTPEPSCCKPCSVPADVRRCRLDYHTTKPRAFGKAGI